MIPRVPDAQAYDVRSVRIEDIVTIENAALYAREHSAEIPGVVPACLRGKSRVEEKAGARANTYKFHQKSLAETETHFPRKSPQGAKRGTAECGGLAGEAAWRRREPFCT